jgi:hypothetical protein
MNKKHIENESNIEKCKKIIEVESSLEVENTSVNIVWSKRITYVALGNGKYGVELNEFRLDKISKDMRGAIYNILKHVCEFIIEKTIINIVSNKTAELISTFVKGDHSAFTDEEQLIISGMVFYFIDAVHIHKNKPLDYDYAKLAKKNLPDNYLYLSSKEAERIKNIHGFSNITRTIFIESGNSSVVMDNFLSPRPKPEIVEEPYVIENLRFDNYFYGKYKAVFSQEKGPQLSFYLVDNRDELIDKLHEMGKTQEPLNCLVTEKIGAKNTLEKNLISVELVTKKHE